MIGRLSTGEYFRRPDHCCDNKNDNRLDETTTILVETANVICLLHLLAADLCNTADLVADRLSEIAG
jgi:hypothetical protein